MVNVVIMSNILHDTEYFFNPREFPEAPKVGDFVDVASFIEGHDKETFEKKISDKNKITVGKVVSRTWGFSENKLALFLDLEFDDLLEE